MKSFKPYCSHCTRGGVAIGTLLLASTFLVAADQEFIKFKSTYSISPTADIIADPVTYRDPFWPVGYKPGKVVNSEKEETVTIPATAFSVTGIAGETGTVNVTVTMNNGKIIADVGEEFPFEFSGKQYLLKIVEVTSKNVVIANGDEKIIVPIQRKESDPFTE